MDEKRVSAHEKSLAELSVKVLSLDARTQANEDRVKALEGLAKRGGFPSESVFYSGEFLDARAFFAELFSKSDREIVIVDSYADSKLLSLLNHAKQGVALSLVKGPHSHLRQYLYERVDFFSGFEEAVDTHKEIAARTWFDHANRLHRMLKFPGAKKFQRLMPMTA